MKSGLMYEWTVLSVTCTQYVWKAADKDPLVKECVVTYGTLGL